MSSDPDLAAGLYEELVTQGLRRRLAALAAAGWSVTENPVDSAESADLVARHLGAALNRLLSFVETGRRVDMANRILRFAESLSPDAVNLEDLLEPGPRELHGLAPARPLGEPDPLRPHIPLSRADLLVNGRGEPSLAREIAAELTSADAVDLVCAFIRWYGLRLLVAPLNDCQRRGVPVRVLTTTYVGATERRAIDELVRLGATVKVNYETQRTRLHAKAWLFHRRSKMDTAYVGSSNLSRSALVDGLEWNVRLSRPDTGPLIEKFIATFDSYWNQPQFETYRPERDAERLDRALRVAKAHTPIPLSGLEFHPYDYQEEILADLDTERQVHGRWRNLIVAATGTGKTVIAALDYRRLRPLLGGDPTLLFVAHRKEILDQSRRTFAEVLRDPTFGETYVAGDRPDRWRHVFASIQSLTAHGIDRLTPDRFDVIIVDEFHHAEARTYRALLEHLRPRVLLGLTATPERADGEDVTRWFDGHIAAELRLWEALEKELLCPFHYFGISDGVDLSGVEWKRGGYDVAELDTLYTGNDARAHLVLREVAEKLPDPRSMRALGFCVSKAHAAYMARAFGDAGVAATTVDSDTPMDDRLARRAQLQRGQLNAIFSVDVFNEGLDVPEVDTVLFLRPTESVTVFLQQLGRGLRRTPGKACLTVLDFIGNQNRRFRFDLRFRAITGSSRRTVQRQIEDGFPFLPSGCAMELDRVATRAVLANIRGQLGLARDELVAEIRSHGDLSLAAYLAEAGRELEEVYRHRGSWTPLRRRAGFPVPDEQPGEERLLRQVHRVARVDDMERITTWGDWLSHETPPRLEAVDARHRRLAAMLFFSFWPDGGGWGTMEAGLEHLWGHAAVRSELCEVLNVAEDRIRHVPILFENPSFADVPLFIHSSYTREEFLAGLGIASMTRKPSSDMQGVRFSTELNADVFNVTLQKAERDYSPTTMYRDYAVAPDLVHWQSQSVTDVSSPTGRRYIHHRELGSHVLLFARQTNDDEMGARPFMFLGPMDYVRHEGSRPISILWRLRRPMPIDFFTEARVAAG